MKSLPTSVISSVRSLAHQPVGRRSPPPLAGARFFFALDSPLSYVMAERVERALVWITWVPVLSSLAEPGRHALDAQRATEAMREAKRGAEALDIALAEPDPYPIDGRRAARAALHAARGGSCQPFALAVARLAFSNGLDISSDSVLRSAAAIAGIDPRAALEAADDDGLDRQVRLTTRALRARGIKAPPAISIGNRWFEGADALMDAMSFRRTRAGLRPDII